MKTHRLALCAMLSAMCAVLGYLSLDLGNLKITFESFPILVGAFLFGPLEGLAVGGVGTLIYQLLRYGVTVTTPLWILPYLLCGLLAGSFARRESFIPSASRLTLAVTACQVLITGLNTAVLYVDSKIFDYYSFAFIFGTLPIRLALCVGQSIVFSLALPPLLKALRRLLGLRTAGGGVL